MALCDIHLTPDSVLIMTAHSIYLSVQVITNKSRGLPSLALAGLRVGDVIVANRSTAHKLHLIYNGAVQRPSNTDTHPIIY